MSEFWKKAWEEELKSYFYHWLIDIAKSLLVLLAIGIFYGCLKLLEHIGYDKALVHYLELLHFCGAAATLIALICLFLWKAIIKP